MTGGVTRIAAERQRQIDKGYTAEQDAERNPDGELGQAAACLAVPPVLRMPVLVSTWPWEVKTWPGAGPNGPGHVTRIQELERAGALIAAEIDRLEALAD